MTRAEVKTEFAKFAETLKDMGPLRDFKDEDVWVDPETGYLYVRPPIPFPYFIVNLKVPAA